MKLFAIAAAGLVTLIGAVPALVSPAAAQHRMGHHREVRHASARHHRTCVWQVRRHHRVRVCR